MAQIDRRTLLRGAAVASLGAAGVASGARTAHAAEVSQNGWPAAPADQLDLDPSWNAAFPPGVLAGDVSVILGYVATRFHEEVEAVYIPGSWGHSYRPITGGGGYSNHASGTAIDCNAPDHPYGSAGTFSSDQIAVIRDILDACGGVVRWGGDYTGNPDDMHFEINVAPGDPAVASVAGQLAGSVPPSHPTIKADAGGPAVTEAQQLLNAKGDYGLAEDGAYGPASTAAVEDFQAANGLTVDGIIGPQTWAALLA